MNAHDLEKKAVRACGVVPMTATDLAQTVTDIAKEIADEESAVDRIALRRYKAGHLLVTVDVDPAGADDDSPQDGFLVAVKLKPSRSKQPLRDGDGPNER